MKQLSKEKHALVLAALREGAPLNSVTRMFNVSIHTVLRVIRDTGEAFLDYMDREFRDLACARIEIDEQWQYVGCHPSRKRKHRPVYERDSDPRGDYWLWACIDADTKLVFSHSIGKRTRETGVPFLHDVRKRIAGPVQVATDNFPAYEYMMNEAFGYVGYNYGIETKILASQNC